jgi:hypothetical protein
MLLVKKKEATKVIAGAGLEVVNFNIGGVIHGFGFDCRKAAAATMTEAEIEADVGKILIKVDGEPKIEMTAAEAIDIWRYRHAQYGAAFTVASVVPIYTNFLGTWDRVVDRSALAWGTKDVHSITAEITISAVATLATIDPFLLVEPDATRTLGKHYCVRRLASSWASASLQQLDKVLPFGFPDVNLQAIHLHQGAGAGVFTDVTLKASSGFGVDNDIFPTLNLAQHNILLHDHRRTAQTGWFHMDLGLLNDTVAGLDLGAVTNLRADITWATNAPLAYTILCEEIRGLTRPTK